MKSSKYFDSEGYHNTTKSGRILSKRATDFFKRHHYLCPPDIKLIRKVPSGAKCLDIATGSGWYLRRLSAFRPDLQLYGFDVEFHPEFPFNSAQFIQGVFSQDFIFPLADSTFDFVSLIDFIEHLSPPALMHLMKESRRVLKVEGYIFIKTPTSRAIYFDFWDDPTHIRPFSKQALERIGSMFGLTVVKRWTRRGLLGYLAAIPLFCVALIRRDRTLRNTALDCSLGLAEYIIYQKCG
jgi:SAM-dependent methyltransferase